MKPTKHKKSKIPKTPNIKKLKEKLRHLKEIHNNYWHDTFRDSECRVSPELPLPEAEQTPIVHLGCLNGVNINDLVTVSLSIPYNTRSATLQNDVLQRLNQEYFGYDGPPQGIYAVDYTPFPDRATFEAFNRDFIGAAAYAPGIQTTYDDPSNIFPPNVAFLNTPYGYCYPNGLCDFSGAGTYGDQSVPDSYPMFLSQNRPVDFNNDIQPIERDVFGRFGVPTGQIYGNIPNSVTSPAPYPWNGPERTSGRTVPVAMQTPFQSTVYLTSNVDIYNQYENHSYGTVQLSQEGLLWSLWPLTRPKKSEHTESATYFSDFTFGTALQSNYPIGQLAYFSNNQQISCVPFGGTFPGLTNASIKTAVTTTEFFDNGGRFDIPGLFPVTQPIVKTELNPARTTGIDSVTGIQTLSSSLILTTKQMVAVLVVKVTEQVARIPNPAAGVSSTNKFIYVGYDGWSVIRTSANPISPMAAQVYSTPQTITGNVTRENLQTIFPPNFPQTIMYKNVPRIAPTSTFSGLFQGASFATASTTK